MTNITDNTEAAASEEVISKGLEKDIKEHATEAEAEIIHNFIEWANESRGLSKELSTATIEQLSVREFLDYAGNIAQHGISGGYQGFRFYSETIEFFEKNRKPIIQWAKDFSESMGVDDSSLSTLSKFDDMQREDITVDEIAELLYSEDRSTLDVYEFFCNSMSWVIANVVCGAYEDFLEEKDDQ